MNLPDEELVTLTAGDDVAIVKLVDRGGFVAVLHIDTPITVSTDAWKRAVSRLAADLDRPVLAGHGLDIWMFTPATLTPEGVDGVDTDTGTTHKVLWHSRGDS